MSFKGKEEIQTNVPLKEIEEDIHLPLLSTVTQVILSADIELVSYF